MVDAPSYDYTSDEVTEIELTESNGDQILNYVNSLM